MSGGTPQTLTIDLPMPPSVNRIWRSRGKVNGKPQYYLDAKYKAWKLQAVAVLANGRTGRPSQVITEPVSVKVVIDAAHTRGDLDNRMKGVLDFLQRAGIIANDSQVRKLEAVWGDAPMGCRVTVTPILTELTRETERLGLYDSARSMPSRGWPEEVGGC